MAGYQPLKITGNATGLVQSREEFLLPDDAYPNLTNAYVRHERILRKGGYELLGRLQRNLTSQVLTDDYESPSFTNNLITLFSLESTSQIVPGSLSISATTPMHNPYAFADFNADGNIITTLGGGYYVPILGITQATQAQITLGGGVFLAGQTVYIQNVTGMTQINNAYYTVVSFIGNVLTINVNSTTFSPYVSGGTVQYVAGSINYSTGSIVLNLNASFDTYTLTAAFGYYPCLPVMGIRIEELANSATDRTIFFDQKYAYIYNQSINSFEEFLPLTMTTWNAAGEPVSGTSFFWSTNSWVTGPMGHPF